MKGIRTMVNRMEYFHQRGCLVSGHGLDYVMYAPTPEEEIEAIFQKALKGESLAWEETAKYKTAFLLFLVRQYHRLGWVENGEYPYDEKALKRMVEGICYQNAVSYFGFSV